MPDTEYFDYVVVGAGAAGCVLADRLSRSGRHTVALVDAGGVDGSPDLDGREAARPAPMEVLPGLQGSRADFDGWAAEGCTGWSWDEVLPFFPRPMPGGAERDGSGDLHPSAERFLDAARSYGLSFRADVNDGTQEGVGTLPAAAGGGGHRRPDRLPRALRRRRNLTLVRRVGVATLIFAGRHATGVEVLTDRLSRRLGATAEVIVAAGTLGTSALLQRSGLGDAAYLQSLGIDPVADLPEVGRNLQDPLTTALKFRTRHPRQSRNRGLRPRGWAGATLRWLLSAGRTAGRAPAPGPGAAQVCGFLPAAPDTEETALQLAMAPLSVHATPEGAAIDALPAITVWLVHPRPRARGTHRILSEAPTDPGELRVIRPEDTRDLQRLADGMAQVRQIMAGPAMRDILEAELEPGPAIATAADLARDLRGASDTLRQPVGSCRMGTDAGAVVDPRLRVKGVTGLRIVDASILPTLPSAGAEAIARMIGAKGAAMVLEDA